MARRTCTARRRSTQVTGYPAGPWTGAALALAGYTGSTWVAKCFVGRTATCPTCRLFCLATTSAFHTTDRYYNRLQSRAKRDEGKSRHHPPLRHHLHGEIPTQGQGRHSCRRPCPCHHHLHHRRLDGLRPYPPCLGHPMHVAAPGLVAESLSRPEARQVFREETLARAGFAAELENEL